MARRPVQPDTITRAECRALMERWLVAFAPQRRSQAIPDAALDEWHAALRWKPVAAAHAAIDRLRDSWSAPGHPKIAHLLAAIRSITGESSDPDRRPAMSRDDPWYPPRCTRCGADNWLAGFQCPDGHVHGRWRCQCEPTGNGWHTEKALAWREEQTTDWHAELRAPRPEPSQENAA